jgi:hypothetical protein
VRVAEMKGSLSGLVLASSEGLRRAVHGMVVPIFLRSEDNLLPLYVHARSVDCVRNSCHRHMVGRSPGGDSHTNRGGSGGLKSVVTLDTDGWRRKDACGRCYDD